MSILCEKLCETWCCPKNVRMVLREDEERNNVFDADF